MQLLKLLVTRSDWIYGRASLHQSMGNIHGYPMYYPSDEGDRIFRNKPYLKYRRIADLKSRPVQPYISAQSLDPWSVVIPVSEIIEEIDCVQKFREWRRLGDSRKEVVAAILRRASIPLSQVGLTGSLALECPGLDPDLDLLIYSSRNVAPCIREIEKMLHRNEIDFMPDDIAKRYARRYSELYRLPFTKLYNLFRLDLTKIYIDGKKISIIFVYDDGEINNIPSVLYSAETIQTVDFMGRVVTGFSSWLYPRHYLVMADDGNIYSVWSHHWLYKGIVSSGSRVRVIANDLGQNVLSIAGLDQAIIPV